VHEQEISSSRRSEVTAPEGPRFSHSNAPHFQAAPPTTNAVRHGLDDPVGAPAAPQETHESNTSASISSSEARRGYAFHGRVPFSSGYGRYIPSLGLAIFDMIDRI
jgi:hypothetical protein